MKDLAKRFLRIIGFPILRYFGPRFLNIQSRLDELVGRFDSVAQTISTRMDHFEARLAHDVETTMELVATAQRSAPPVQESAPVQQVQVAPVHAAPQAALDRLQRTLVADSGLSYNKVCNLEDFVHPSLQPVLRAIFAHELERLGPEFPQGFEHRKNWEVAMAVRALSDLGVLHDRAEILGVGAGNEPTIFYLTNLVHRVFATDIYLEPGVWKEFANSSMLMNPGRHWPFAWNPRRLVAQHMSAMDLMYEDCTFDAIFSSSSVEHFGELADIERSMDEMYRVLKPGGILSISTEFRIEGDTMGVDGCLMFDREELIKHLVGERSWDLVTELDSSVSAPTQASAKPHDEYMKDFQEHVEQAQGSVGYHELEFRHWPQIVMSRGPLIWTSALLTLRKASAGETVQG